MNKTLFLMVGVPGSGKSTFIKKQIKESKYPVAYISRDEIRFSKLKDGQDYFSNEKKVFKEFCKKIQDEIDNGANIIYADATHISETSRNKTLDKLNLENVDVCPIVFNIPLKTCLERNKLRTGRAFVFPGAIVRMYNSFEIPTDKEKHKYKNILIIEE